MARRLGSGIERNGLERTAKLNQQTADALIDNTGIDQGSNIPSQGGGAGSMANSYSMSNFRGHDGQK